ncbi:MAG: 2'-5' RNA ligase family protein [Chloroflexota bacterium]|nr:2'-5' RNA ligase family protein [Chloroflexota bacterium]
MKKQSRFAFFLVPPYHIAKDIAEIHSMLKKQYGLSAAGRFQVHCTIKGFFKSNERPIETLIEELDTFLNAQKPFMVEFNGCYTKPISIVLRLDEIDGTNNQTMLDFREAVVEIIRPYIAGDCDFIKSDLGLPFKGHVTLAFRDITNEMYPQILEWLKDAPIPKGKFQANTFHFLEFYSEDWDGNWWETITWKLHRSWRLNSL